MPKIFIIAEAGVNHNGSLKIARKMVDAAVRAGADAVKFQTFNADTLVTRSAPKAAYQKMNTDEKESQFAMIRGLELDLNAHKALLNYCRSKKIVFLSSPFDVESAVFLNRLGLKIIKIPSGEITNLPYLRKVGSFGKKIILSTGMSDLREIRDAIDVLVQSGATRENITVLHCTTQYPTPLKDVNLSAMLTVKEKLRVRVGYSDHTAGIAVSIAAAALGAAVIEKHFTLGRRMSGPDHKASLEPDELAALVDGVRSVEAAFGSGVKQASPSERANISVVRKSIVARVDIKKGELFGENNLAVKRPGTGINPMRWDALLNKAAKKDFCIDELITI